MRKVVLSWSGGKDSTLALKRLLEYVEIEVVGLMTAFQGKDQVVNLHYVPYHLIQKQADALNLQLFPIFLSEKPKNEEYEREHIVCFEKLKKQGIYEIAFGDIHLEPIKEYRDRLLESAGMKGHYPLWGKDPKDLIREFIDSGYRSMTTAIDALKLDDSFLGKILDNNLLLKLKEAGVDECGENGEYHSFVFDGPAFKAPIKVNCHSYFEKDFRPEIEMKLKACHLKI